MVVLKRWETGREWETLPLDTLREADLAGRFMPGVDFQDADLTGASLRKANCDHARFRYASLRRADLREAILVEADLSFADLRQADLRGAMLEAADLRAARLDGAQLRGCTFSRATVWPTSFAPEADGAVRVGGFDPGEHFPLAAAESAQTNSPLSSPPPAPLRLREYGAPEASALPPWEAERLHALFAVVFTTVLIGLGLLLR